MNLDSLLPLITLLLGAALAAIALWRYYQAADRNSRQNLEELRYELKVKQNLQNTQQQELDELKQRMGQAQEHERALEKQLTETQTENNWRKQRLEELEQDKRQRLEDNERLRAEHNQLHQEHATLKANYRSLQEKLDSQQTEMHELRDRFLKEFQLVSNKLLKENTASFKQESQERLGELLNPLKEKLLGFEKKVEEMNKEHFQSTTTLKTQIEHLTKLNNQISEDANRLTQALKGDSKTQGNWGEAILTRLLELAGLREGEHYTTQQSYSHQQEEGRYIPDVVVHLPEGKHLVIDSKVSLRAYEEYHEAAEDQARTNALNRHVAALRNHIDSLNKKDYTQLVGVQSPDFVLMFVPIEPAFLLAAQHDRELQEYGHGKRVILISPTLLLGTLNIVATLWKHDQQRQNAAEIAKRGGELYDKFINFSKDFQEIGKNLERAQESYEKSFKRLRTGKGNLVRQTEMLRELGAKTSKQQDPALLEQAEMEDLELEPTGQED